MPLLIIGRMRATRSSQEIWTQLSDTRCAQAILAVIQATENWDLWIVPVATRVAREVFYQFNVIIESYLIGPDLIDPAVTPSLVILNHQ